VKRPRIYFGVETKRVRETSPLERLDAILKQARKDLVRRGEELETMLDRVQDAEDDPTRILVYARLEDRTAGIVDGHLHTPAPNDVTIAQIAVSPRLRNQNVGRALVLDVLLRARKEAPELGALVASVHSDNHGAASFWEALGLRTDEKASAADDNITYAGPAEELLEALKESAG
jgi:ribosomal protein S18 acetylase RimI-like enzyme